MSGERDTIFGISSGAPPAAIGIVRVSGPEAGTALHMLAGRKVEPRRATYSALRSANGALLDRALVLWFPGPASATGEDLAELHCHGGRAVLAAIMAALDTVKGLRPAREGEFTRRAFANGRIDLAEAEGLADLLSAETESQRAAAMAQAAGAFSRQIEDWRGEVLLLSATVEAALDFSDEDDVETPPAAFRKDIGALVAEIATWLERPRAERLKEGFRVVLAGPPNSGKSTLFNALVESEAAIISPIAGTTRDAIERSVALGGVAFTFIDTAGLRERDETSEAIEAIGIERARDQMTRADLVLWLGQEGEGPATAWEIAARADAEDFTNKDVARHRISAATGEGMAALIADLVETARIVLPKPGEAALNSRQAARLSEVHTALEAAGVEQDWLLIGENLRQARAAFDRLIGRTTTEDMLDALFGRFCIGK